MKNSLQIITSTDKPELLENMVEKLACRHYDIGFSKVPAPQSWKSVEISSVEKYISGTVELSVTKKISFKIPFITSFLFTCTKKQNETYRLSWEISLS